MTWNLKSDRPIYTQLLEYIQLAIIAGIYKPGEKLPSVRDMAEIAAVNPNTMQKALTELEKRGLVYSQRTSGRFITEDESMIQDLKKTIAKEEIREFLKKMNQLGYDNSQIQKLINDIGKEQNQ